MHKSFLIAASVLIANFSWSQDAPKLVQRHQAAQGAFDCPDCQSSKEKLKKIETETQKLRSDFDKHIQAKMDEEKSKQGPTALAVGQKIMVPGWQWVEMTKSTRQEFRNGSKLLAKGDRCGIQEGATVAILGFSKDEQHALVEYSLEETSYGTPCPSGAEFFLTVKDLSTFDERYREITAKRKAEAEEVDLILEGKSTLKSVDVFTVSQTVPVRSWIWVDVVKPISQEFRSVNLGGWQTPDSAILSPGPRKNGTCGIEEGGELSILGFSSDRKRALVKYTIAKRQLGTPCPSGAVFFLNVTTLSWFNNSFTDKSGTKRW